MKHLLDVINRKLPPTPWEEGDCIPWSDPAFSERMLKEHLRQDHDAASRRTEKIDEQVAWIHGDLLAGQPTKVLDLTCGPGLYTSRLARLGHECVGIDYAPAAIRYADDNARHGTRRRPSALIERNWLTAHTCIERPFLSRDGRFVAPG